MVLCGILCALALVLSIVDRFIPLEALVPLPGVKLGLANIATIFALYVLGAVPALLILIARCLLGSIFAGSITAFMFSLLGGIFSLIVMSLLKNAPFLSLIGVSIAGAAFHGIGQVCAAAIMLGNIAVFAYLPVLLIVSLFTGTSIAAASAAIIKAVGNAANSLT